MAEQIVGILYMFSRGLVHNVAQCVVSQAVRSWQESHSCTVFHSQYLELSAFISHICRGDTMKPNYTGCLLTTQLL